MKSLAHTLLVAGTRSAAAGTGLVRPLLALALCATATSGYGQVRYSLIDLSDYWGTNYSCAVGIDNAGQVVGWEGWADWSDGPPMSFHPIKAFLYSGGTMINLDALLGGPGDSNASGINNFGQVVGQVGETNFIYSGGTFTFPSMLSGTAVGINDSGEVAGQYYAVQHPLTPHAFLWSAGVLNDLGTLPPAGGDSCATALNASGQVAGCSTALGSPEHAFLCSGGTMTDLNPTDGSVWASAAYGISPSGIVVGSAWPINWNVGHAVMWSGAGMTDLTPSLGASGYGSAAAFGVNLSGQVVGDLGLNGLAEAFVYSGGVLTNLNDRLDATGAGYRVDGAYAINDAGQIAGSALVPAEDEPNEHAILLTPDAGLAATVALQDYAGDVTQIPVMIEIRYPGTATVLQRMTVDLKPDGSFSFPSALVGTFDVAAKASHWLRRTIPSVTFPGTGYVTGLSFSLINGDVNGDDDINLADSAAISLAWRTKPGDPKWNPNADLNGDGTINLADAVIVSKNWRKSGDP